jgi:hydrogenase maturation protease
VQKLKAEVFSEAQVIEASGEGASLIEYMKDRECVLMFDAVYSGAKPGTILRFEVHNESIPTKFFNYSTHAFSVAEAIELARAMNQLPKTLLLYGVEGQNFGSGTELSSEVRNAIPEIIEKVLNDIEQLEPKNEEAV